MCAVVRDFFTRAGTPRRMDDTRRSKRIRFELVSKILNSVLNYAAVGDLNMGGWGGLVPEYCMRADDARVRARLEKILNFRNELPTSPNFTIEFRNELLTPENSISIDPYSTVAVVGRSTSAEVSTHGRAGGKK